MDSVMLQAIRRYGSYLVNEFTSLERKELTVQLLMEQYGISERAVMSRFGHLLDVDVNPINQAGAVLQCLVVYVQEDLDAIESILEDWQYRRIQYLH